MNDLISRKALIAEYDRVHVGPPGGARKLMEDAPAVDEPHWATEQAYKNGYEQGKKDALKWIPVSERLPEKITNKVIVLCKNGYRGFGHYENYKGKQTWYNLESDKPFTDWDLEDCESYEVTHWMPLPEPPKGE